MPHTVNQMILMQLHNSAVQMVQLRSRAVGEEKVFLRDDSALCFTSQMGPQTLVQGRTGCRAVARRQNQRREQNAVSGALWDKRCL